MHTNYIKTSSSIEEQYMMQIGVLIIEDDILWQTKILMIAEEIGLNVKYVANNIEKSKTYLQNHTVELIISDIILENEIVFDLFIQNTEFRNLPVILLTTSVDLQHYEQAKMIKNHIYLVKPVHALTLKSAIETIIPQKKSTKRAEVIIQVKGKYNEKVDLYANQILWLYQKRNYCFIHTLHQTYSIKKSLVVISDNLNNDFIQIHRSIYININFIDRITTDLSYVIINDNKLSIGKLYKNKVKEFIADKF